MVSSTLSQNVYSRAEGIADHYWPWAVFFLFPCSSLSFLSHTSFFIEYRILQLAKNYCALTDNDVVIVIILVDWRWWVLRQRWCTTALVV